MKNPLLDNEFLYALNQYQHKEIYARIIALTFDEQPLETIEGRVTSGSINIDGNSAVRRTCNLGLIAKDVNITDFYWGVSNKFTLEIGVKNFINDNYPEIIWFKQGIYVITSFNSSLTNNNYSISIGGKDKMCLLNGDVSGNISSPVDFGMMDILKDVFNKIEIEDHSKYEANKYYYYDLDKKEFCIATESFDPNLVYYAKDTLVEKVNIPIKKIIFEAVHAYGKEAYQNIIINDIDDYGLELLQYRGEQDLFLLYNESTAIYDQILINGEYQLKCESTGKINNNTYKSQLIPIQGYFSATPDNKIPIGYNTAIDNFGNEDKWLFSFPDDEETTLYSITKVSNKIEEGKEGMFDSSAVGYRFTDLTYPGELIASIGESLTSILDKIKNMLGPFEYFYDLDGKFVFQAKKIYSNQSWSSLVETDDNIFARDAIETSAYSYSFEDVNLISQFTNTPAINNVKNDYSIWGVRKGVTGIDIPIHARYAIDKKPTVYTSIEITETEAKKLMETYPERYLKLEKTQQNSTRYVAGEEGYDWRELIYQMASDYYKYGQLDFFTQKLIEANRNDNLYLSGTTGYEHYYADMQGFWRQLYDPNPKKHFQTTGGKYLTKKFYQVLKLTKENFEKNPLHYFTLEDEEKSIFEFLDWTEEDSVEIECYTDNEQLKSNDNYIEGIWWEAFEKSDTVFTCDYYLKGPIDNSGNYSPSLYYWNKNINKAPETLNFWIDFYEGDDSLQQYAIPYIGDRVKVTNNSKITSVYFRKVPQLIFINAKDFQLSQAKTGYIYIYLPDEMIDLFSISTRGKSAEEEMTELFNQFSYCTESISITTIPIYYLEPNTIIYIRNDENNINGKYQITRLSIPLTYNGMMSISATKIIDAVY